jgi:hypothetical protein
MRMAGLLLTAMPGAALAAPAPLQSEPAASATALRHAFKARGITPGTAG